MRVTYQPADQISRTINRLRMELQDQGYAFGALFAAQMRQDSSNMALFFADGMPQATRAQLLKDLRRTLDEAEKRFRI